MHFLNLGVKGLMNVKTSFENCPSRRLKLEVKHISAVSVTSIISRIAVRSRLFWVSGYCSGIARIYAC